MTTTAAATATAIDRLDDGVLLPGDRDLAEIFDAHCRKNWWVFARQEETRAVAALLDRMCPVRLVEDTGGDECIGCFIEHDHSISRSNDI